jgi:hypothetical protein
LLDHSHSTPIAKALQNVASTTVGLLRHEIKLTMISRRGHPQVLAALVVLHSASAMATIGMTTSSSVLRAKGIVRRPQSFVSNGGFTRNLSPAIHSPLFSAVPADGPTSSAASAAAATITASVKKHLLSFRGGSTEFALSRMVKGAMNDVAGSKAKSWCVLFVAVLIETLAASLSKRARQTGNPQLFAFSLSLNLIRYARYLVSSLLNLLVG